MKAPELKERLEESEKLIQEMTVTWEDKLRKTEAIAMVTQTEIHSLQRFKVNFVKLKQNFFCFC